MNKTRVSIVKAHNYDLPEVRAAVEKSIDLLGGLAGIIPSGSKVFVKVNHLSPPSPAERGIVTHPVFVEAALDVLKGTGAEITVGDDIESGDGDGFLVSGIRQVCQRAGVRLINLREEGFVETECNGRFLDKVYSSKAVQEADLIVNLPKLKTHSLTVFTGGIKNMYGTIPIGLRRKFHGEYIRSQDFCQMLTDIFATVIPRLTIMDGIVAMEGEGPSGGKLRNLGLVLASRDAVALDAVASKIIGLNPQDIHTTRYAHERGLGRADLDNIEVVGETVESTAVADFRLPASASTAILGRVPRFLSRFILAQLAIKPKVVQQNCTGCAECEKTCPRGAITVSHDIAEINDSICIQCMCCHEVCRFDAIVPQQSALGRTVSSVTNIIRKLMSTA
jgi:uncharacterized protein (DUF362 family)/NAD-dependent dihydropyrimidine dehydrogenase PreA subunit